MKKYICILFSILTLAGCTLLTDEVKESNKPIEDAIRDHEERIEELESQCAKINENLRSISAILKSLQANDYLKSVEAIEEDGEIIGYSLIFEKSGVVTIFHGEDMYNPQIGISKDEDGLHYWTLDGDWLLDKNGNKIRAEGIDAVTPQLRIVDDVWEVSYDGGKTWTKLGNAVGEDGKSFFSSVTVTESSIELVLIDGTSLSIPFKNKIEIKLMMSEENAGISGGKDIYVGYELSGELDGAVVTASSDGHYIVRVESSSIESGNLVITCPDTYADGFVNLCVNDVYGYSYVKVIRFYESKMIFSEGLEYAVSSEGGTIEIPYSVNFNYTLKVHDGSSSWMTILSSTKGDMRDESISLMVKKNNSFSARQGKVLVYAENNKHTPYTEITVNQASSYFSVDKLNHAFPEAGGTKVANVVSTVGLKVQKETDATWLNVNTVETEKNHYEVRMTVGPNYGDNERNDRVYLYSADGRNHMATINIMQLNQDAYDPDDMVFTVRVNYVTDFTAYLPLYDYMECIVDWGDGSVDYYNSNSEWVDKVYHKYDVNEPQNYIVSISGYVTALRSDHLNYHSVVEVNQWGNVGLNSMSWAFGNNRVLKRIPEDTQGAFRNVNSFSCAFYSCQSMEEIPSGLFSSCENLHSLNSAFWECHSLASIPENLLEGCDQLNSVASMFSRCSSITSIPENLFKDCVSLRQANSMFSECTSLSSIPSRLLADCTNLEEAVDMFRQCSALTSVPDGLFSGCTDLIDVGSLFYNCPLITSIPGDLLEYCSSLESAYTMFGDCYSLTEVPGELFSYSPELNNIESIFNSCQKLESVPVEIFDNNRMLRYLGWAFSGCWNLKGESPYTVIDGRKVHLYERCDYPDYFLEPEGYDGAFSGTQLSDLDNMPERWRW